MVRTRSLTTGPIWSHWLVFAVWLLSFNLAHIFLTRRLPGRDALLLPAAGLLTGWGLLTIFRLYPSFGLRQAGWLALATVIFILGLNLSPDFRFLRRYKYLWLSGGLLLTGLTLFLGVNPLGYGPKMWLGCCGIYLQPSEPLKLLLIVYLAAYLADRLFPPMEGKVSLKAKTLIPVLAPSLIMTGLALVLLVIQRDLGTASIFLFLYAVMVYIASGRRRIALIALATLLAASVAGFLLFDVVRVRFDAWLNPWLDPSGRSYQIVQSLLAIANGGLIGRGPGLGNPGLVPVPHSDFIFTAVFEEIGLVGAVGFIVLIALLVYAGLRSALRAPDAFQRYLAAGLTAYLVGQSILIIGGNLRLLPLTGVTLPFVSYGGSSLVVSMISLLFLVLISNAGSTRQTPLVNPKPLLELGALLLVGLAATVILAGWWSVARSSELLIRTDNPRLAINDRYVRRGSLLDRENRPINLTEGESGEMTRQITYPDLSPIVGYTDPVYGQAGLEASLDSFLRGLKGNPPGMVWVNHLLYGQPPSGLDVRTSLDLDLQANADRLLSGQQGALVLLNAQTGEVLAMASHPTFNANRLAELGESLIKNPDAPLLNRATQGLYPTGAALGPFLLAKGADLSDLPAAPGMLTYSVDQQTLVCAARPDQQTWPATIAAGCPGPVSRLGEQLGTAEVNNLFTKLGLYTPPQAYLPASSSAQANTDDPAALATGYGVSISPLQMSLAAATLSAGGIRPAPYLVTAVKEPEVGWVVFSVQGQAQTVLPVATANKTANDLAVAGQPFWRSLAVAPDGEQKVTWFLGGTLPEWNGTPLALVVLLEEDNPDLAEEIGQKMLLDAMGR
jgi:cell division protein FtsW (lipid II flippase)